MLRESVSCVTFHPTLPLLAIADLDGNVIVSNWKEKEKEEKEDKEKEEDEMVDEMVDDEMVEDDDIVLEGPTDIEWLIWHPSGLS